jgi:hypothetical protein
MKRTRHRIGVAFAIAACASASAPHARAEPADGAEAQRLFDEARVLMASGRYAEACPMLAESFRRDASGGTILHLALCRDAEGKVASAKTAYEEAIRFAERDARRDREDAARARLAALLPRLSYVVVHVPAEARAAASVLRDGEIVEASEWEHPVAVDPGAHTYAASAPGMRAWSTVVTVSEQPTTTEIAVVLAPEDAPPAALPSPSPREPGRGGPSRGTRAVAIGVGAAGATSIAVGLVFGALSLDARSDARRLCGTPSDRTCSNPTGVDASKRAVRFGDVSTGTLLIGAGVLAAGLALWLFGPREERVARISITPTAVSRGGAAIVGGAW